MKFVYLVLICTIFSFSVYSQDLSKFGMETIAEGLNLGSIAPDFEGLNQQGEKVSLSEKLKSGSVVLIFYRGYWCPYCSKHLNQLQDSLLLLVKKGVHVIAITPEQEEGVNKTIEKTETQFDIISDKGNSIQKKYHVLFKVTEKYTKKIKTFLFTDIARNNQDAEAYLPVPATYIIGQDKTIKYVQFDPNYKNRSSVKEILDNL